MPSDSAQATLDAYIAALRDRGDYARFFATDVRCELVGTDQAADGPEAVEQTIRYLHEVAFDAHPELKTAFAVGDKAAVEVDFVGVHKAEFAGLPASGADVRVPYSVIYDLRDDRIAALRIYMPMDVLIGQIQGARAGATPATA